MKCHKSGKKEGRIGGTPLIIYMLIPGQNGPESKKVISPVSQAESVNVQENCTGLCFF